MTRTPLLRLTLAAVLVTLAAPGCTRLMQADPLNKTTSIVNGSQVTRGPSRGTVPAGFASTAAPAGNSFEPATGFEPAIGEPFGVEELGGLSGYDASLPELQGIDFGTEQAAVTDFVASGTIPADETSSEYFVSNIGQTVYFATNSSELTDRARETLRRQAAWLNINTDARVSIEGHADERGTREYNLALGDRRATATRGYLIAVGVDESRLDKTSYGKERPVALGSDEQAWAQNRRTETVIEGGGDSFANNPLTAAQPTYDVTTTALDSVPVVTEYAAPDSIFPQQPLISGTSDSLILDPLFPDTGTTALIAPPGQTNYETTSGLYAPVGEPAVFDSGTIAPTVFDTTTLAPSPAPVPYTGTTTYSTFDANPAPIGSTVTGTPSTRTTRIEDVSVDDLLRDPSLIDRIGTPATPGS